uniref:Divergent polysaccharide deacetylase family protein n=1 Tax=Desulfacinum infernum TaxID=35837 RepID=A0A832A1W7_9BACT
MASTQGKKRPAGAPVRGAAAQRSRRSPAGSAGAQRKQPKDSVFLPLVTVWVVILFLLVTLLYWTRGNPFRAVPSGVKGKETASVAVPRPEKQASSEKPSPAKRSNAETEEDDSRDGEKPKGNAVVASVPSVPPGPPVAPVPPKKPPVARVALVIDDFGHDVKIARKFIHLPLPMTFSVLPHLPHTEEVAALAAAHGHEVMLHMPMEPHGYPKTDPGRGALLVAMTPQQIVSEIDKALKENPYARGINNHMGSKFTEDPQAMKIVLRHLKDRGFYYLDSYTSPHSVGLSVAQELGMPCMKRDIFLDHEPTEAFVRRQVEELIRRAKVEGQAVAIGHPHPVTLKVLEQKAETFEKEGIEVVPLKKLLEGAATENGATAGA